MAGTVLKGQQRWSTCLNIIHLLIVRRIQQNCPQFLTCFMHQQFFELSLTQLLELLKSLIIYPTGCSRPNEAERPQSVLVLRAGTERGVRSRVLQIHYSRYKKMGPCFRCKCIRGTEMKWTSQVSLTSCFCFFFLLVVFRGQGAIGEVVLGFPHHEKDTVVQVLEHGALVFRVSAEHRLFLHLKWKGGKKKQTHILNTQPTFNRYFTFWMHVYIFCCLTSISNPYFEITSFMSS